MWVTWHEEETPFLRGINPKRRDSIHVTATHQKGRSQSSAWAAVLLPHQLGWALTPKTGAVQVRQDRLTAVALLENGHPSQTRKLSIWQD